MFKTTVFARKLFLGQVLLYIYKPRALCNTVSTHLLKRSFQQEIFELDCLEIWQSNIVEFNKYSTGSECVICFYNTPLQIFCIILG